MSDNKNLARAKENKNDEYYTQYKDVEEEISNYGGFLKGKTVYCPCDTMESAFYRYFVNNFSILQLKKLIISSSSSSFSLPSLLADDGVADAVTS